MTSLSAGQLLSLWERGRWEHPIRQALLALNAAHPHLSPEALAQLPLGRRDRLLFELRRQLFGGELSSVVDCERCGESLEFSLQVSELLAQPAGPQGEDALLTLASDGYEIRFRLPTSQDLLEAAESGDRAGARERLLDLCLVEVRHGPTLPPGEGTGSLPPPLRAAVVERMAEADPLADIRIALACPVCGHAWQAGLDAAAYLWDEIQAWARQSLLEVHWLASAYHWREQDILAMSAARRRLYLEMIRG